MDELEEPSLEGLLSGMSEEEMVALGNEIFDLDSAPPPGAAPLLAPNTTSNSAIPVTQSQAVPDPKPVNEARLSPEERVDIEQALQRVCGGALNEHHLQLLNVAMDSVPCSEDNEPHKLSNPGFAAVLQVTIDCAVPKFAAENFLAGPVCDVIAQMLKLTVTSAEQVSQNPGSRPWCDVKALFTDYFRLAKPGLYSDDEKSYSRTLDRLMERPFVRPAIQLPSSQAVLDICSRMPNFAEPLTFIAEQVALQRLRNDGQTALPPVLLLGPPGVGKTLFASEIARLLGSSVRSIALASQSNGWILSGLDRGWSNSRPGHVMESLAYGPNLSPVIVLDEIDKVTSDGKSDPLGALYQLLEPASARQFRDESIDFTMDASQIIWLATANDERAIPAPLLSRFAVFHIAAPEGPELQRILQGMYRDAVRGLPGVPPSMPHDWARQCQRLSLRACRQAIAKAVGRAALRTDLRGEDTVRLLAQDMCSTSMASTRKLGFLD